MLSTAILVGVLPWTNAGLSSSPYSDVFDLLLGAMVFYLFADFAYLGLASLSGFGFLLSWLMTALSHPGQRELAIRKGNGKAVWKVPFYPTFNILPSY